MKSALLFAVIALGVSGCESLSDAAAGVRDRVVARSAPQTKTYEAPSRAAYDAVRSTATEMGYRFVRGGPAQGEFEAISRVGSGETMGSARQVAMKVALRTTLDGKGTEVAVRLTEIIEADSSNRAGQATESPLRDTPHCVVLCRRVGEMLGGEPTAGR